MIARVAALLALLQTDPDWRDPNPDRAHVSALEHALQTATRARQHDSEDHEMIVAALLHDAARPLSDPFHGEVMAEILRDRVRYHVYFALYNHGEYQSALLHQYPLPEGPPEATKLAAWDASSFDPNFESDQLASFLPELNDLLS